VSGQAWYQDGLCFGCRQCGACCSGAPGYVWVTREEIRRIAAFLGRSEGWLSGRELRRIRLAYSLTELANGDCIFLERADGRAACRIYPVRPVQCRTWPFWQVNLKSAEAWAEVGRMCPGLNNGRCVPLEQIEDLRQARW
jgi:Fe-S-cluster containining protein